MKRTVKAWGYVSPSGELRLGIITHDEIGLRRCADTSWSIVVPLTITYDDGMPSPRKRKARKRGK